MDLLRRRSPDVLAAIFGVSSIVHLARPQVLESLVPGWLPHPRLVVYVSGVAELICAVALLQRWRHAGLAAGFLLAGVFPGNVQMAVDAVRDADGAITAGAVLALGRLPLQLPLIWMALQAEGSVPLRWVIVARRA